MSGASASSSTACLSGGSTGKTEEQLGEYSNQAWQGADVRQLSCTLWDQIPLLRAGKWEGPGQRRCPHYLGLPEGRLCFTAPCKLSAAFSCGHKGW